MKLNRTSWTLLALMIATVLANVVGIPGLAVETRSADSFPTWIALAALITLVGPLLVAGGLFFVPRVAAWIAIVVGVVATLFNAVDFFGLVGPTPPSVAVRLLEVVYIGLAIASIIYARKLLAAGVPMEAGAAPPSTVR